MNRRLFRALLVLLAILTLIPAYLHAYAITGSSEIPNVMPGDTIIVNSAAWRFTGTPHRGDFVFLHLAREPRLRGFFKRILALPGETFEMRENAVFINGGALPVAPLKASLLREDGHWITFTPGKSPRRNIAPVHLANDEYYLLGDNRDDSRDSRDFGPVNAREFEGKVIAVVKR